MKRRLWAGMVMLAIAGAAACSSSTSGNGADSGEPGGNDGGPLAGGDGSSMPPGDDGGTGMPDATLNDAPPPDTMAPMFAGATSATALGQAQVAVTWAPATDDVTAQASIAYRVYLGTSAGGENFMAPVVTSPAGAV
ncbi:MAG TPA: hypothetical protein VGI39_14190, partial [Polyangiaceae bacterium]